MASPAGYRVNAITLIFTVIAGATVALRLITRFAILRNAGFEDVCITLAMGFSIALTIAISEQVRNGMGMHIFELTPKMMVDSQKAFWVSVWVYYMALTFTKVSILVQYLRIFPTPRFRVACFVMLAFVGGFGIWNFFSSIFLCSPVPFFWDKSIKDGTCLNQFVVWFFNAGSNILQDVLILLLPMPVLRRLSIPRNQKRLLMIIFALGGFVCIISIIRLQTLVRISNSTDPTYDNPPAATFSSVETNVGILCACLPAIRPLLSTMLPNYFPATTRLTSMQTNDEERLEHKRTRSSSTSSPGISSRPATASTRPYTAQSSRTSHSRSNSISTTASRNGSELNAMYTHEAMLHAPARQITISTMPRATLFSGNTPRLPRLPENIALMSPVEESARRNGGWRPQLRTSVVQKPLPVTPLPTVEQQPWFWKKSDEAT
ncbi:hypothetical protein EJ04DRAFT_423379 [Polyplosphaeria fusca]|uniref:Rhodopsin domain-containing protein n=1 Tax=Polyplosphaeria fusca TaxID=682080 RepID=A0A9P4RAA5_9PLEO|nr:hypothetical protein EJ04DRAFT_423379 [Polyplosphaeria fusca]